MKIEIMLSFGSPNETLPWVKVVQNVADLQQLRRMTSHQIVDEIVLPMVVELKRLLPKE